MQNGWVYETFGVLKQFLVKAMAKKNWKKPHFYLIS
jgi:hypothetical protein